MISPAPPFTCTYSPNVAELLIQLNCSLAITTFQAGRLIFLSPDGPNVMRQRYVSMFGKTTMITQLKGFARGMAKHGDYHRNRKQTIFYSLHTINLKPSTCQH
jgi:hypothetical protein